LAARERVGVAEGGKQARERNLSRMRTRTAAVGREGRRAVEGQSGTRAVW